MSGTRKKDSARKTPGPYPWLDEDYPRRNMTDEGILYKYIDLSKCHLTDREKEEVMDLMIANKQAFSLRDEIGKCPDVKVRIKKKKPFHFLC